MPARLAGRSAKVSLKYQSGQNGLHHFGLSSCPPLLSSPLLSRSVAPCVWRRVLLMRQVAVATLSSPAGNFCLRSKATLPFTADW